MVIMVLGTRWDPCEMTEKGLQRQSRTAYGSQWIPAYKPLNRIASARAVSPRWYPHNQSDEATEPYMAETEGRSPCLDTPETPSHFDKKLI